MKLCRAFHFFLGSGFDLARYLGFIRFMIYDMSFFVSLIPTSAINNDLYL